MTNSILAIQDYTKYLPHAIVGVCGLVLLVAFIIGFVKGVRRVRWGGVAWLLAGVTYFLASKYLADKNPINNLLKGLVADSVLPFFVALSFALASIVVVGLVYGLFVLILRPKKDKKKKARGSRMDEIGLRYEEDGEFDGTRYHNKNLRAKPKKKKVSFPGRLFGALLCTINTAMIVAVALTALLFVVDGTALKTGFFASIYEYEITEKIIEYAYTYGFDLAIIGIIFGFMLKGTKVGFVDAIRIVFIKFGGVISVILGLYLPFSPFASSVPGVGALTLRCRGLFGTLGTGEKVAYYGGNILAGLLLVVVLILAFWLINFLLKHLGNGLRKVAPFKALDSGLSAIVYIVLGVVVVLLIWLALYILSYYEIFNAQAILREFSELSEGIFNFFDTYLKEYLITVTDKIKGFIEKIYSFIQ